MQIFVSFVIGLIFGLGLILSGMTNPAKVIGFLDILGDWDPSLVLVMISAIIMNASFFHLTKYRKQSFLGLPLNLPTNKSIDHKLIIGSAIFGVGWGLAGFCPGPSIVSILQSGYQPLVFVISMLVGMLFFELFNKHTRISNR